MLILYLIHASCIALYFRSQANKKYITTNSKGWLVLGDRSKAKKFTLKPGPDTKVFIQDQDKRVWDIEGGKSNVILYSKHGGSNQQYEVTLSHTGFNIISVLDSCLQFSNDDQMRIYRAPCDGSIVQEWKSMEELPSPKNKAYNHSHADHHHSDFHHYDELTSHNKHNNVSSSSDSDTSFVKFNLSNSDSIECDESNHNHYKAAREHKDRRKHKDSYHKTSKDDMKL
ncbi:hypothetical protein TCON_0035 [Astathelohania contejeani]|uniref:Ricin B lectin domain-containing protein n=1 Tax=Astathelohania contejeani TaxID=164912 RepID=A0ABQ7I2Y8_9MICR|nr:hypothetical protein TCON_0035 [Thelohania contejeani]